MEGSSSSQLVIETTERLDSRRSKRRSRGKGPSTSRETSRKTEDGLPFVFEEDILKESLRFSDLLIDFILVLKSTRFRLWMKRIFLFGLSGFFYKIWMWFTACVLLWYNAPCLPEHNLFTMPFVFTSIVGEYEWISPYFFSFFDEGHFVLSVFTSALAYLAVEILKKLYRVIYYFYDKIKIRFQSYTYEAKRRKIQRRNEVRHNTQKKKDD